jgi:Zn-dependent protease with chaperone function
MRGYATTIRDSACVVTLAALLTACAVETASAPRQAPRAETSAPRASTAKVDAGQVERLKRVMTPLLKAMDKSPNLSQVKVGILDDPDINAANAGKGEFYVTTGLLQKANDAQLTAIMAHEVAHEDLGHVAKAKTLGAGLNIGMVILDQIIPGSGAITPIAGALVSRAYSRKEEYAADRHGVELLKRTGQSPQIMVDTLTWLMQMSGSGGGGFFATHPATGDRIDALRQASAR